MTEISEFQLQQMIKNQIDQAHEQKQEEKEVMPSYVPRFKCSGANCNENHRNPNFTQLPTGRCTNCEQFSKSTEGTCAWCNHDNIEELDADDLKDMDVTW